MINEIEKSQKTQQERSNEIEKLLKDLLYPRVVVILRENNRFLKNHKLIYKGKNCDIQ